MTAQNFVLFGSTMTGTAGNDTLTGAASTIAIYGGDGDDQIIINSGQFNAGEILDGGTGTNTLATVGAVDLTSGILSNFQALTFSSAGTDTLTGAQTASGFSAAVTVTGGAGVDTLIINDSGGAAVDLSGWTFANWSAGDSVVFTGSGASDHLTLNTLSGTYAVTLGAGSDTLSLAAPAASSRPAIPSLSPTSRPVWAATTWTLPPI